MATVGLKRKRLCSAYGKRDDCGVDACPHQGRGQPHSHVWAVCPSPDAESHADHACGFRPSVRTKAASTLADGSLSGWVNHSRNAIEFASRHFASDYQHEHEPAASTGLVHHSKFDRCTPQCPLAGQAHAHCYACRCPDPTSASHGHHSCGFRHACGEATTGADGTLIGWAGQHGNADRHYARCHGEVPGAQEISGV